MTRTRQLVGPAWPPAANITDLIGNVVSDDAGNRNNLLIVKPLKSPTVEKHEASSMHSTSSAPEAAAEDPPIAEALKDGEGSRSSHDAAPEPIPVTVVEKATHSEQPFYDGKKRGSLHEDPGKRTADAEPDAEYEPPVALSNHVKSDSETATPIPAVVLEKTDDRPVHGDDLGANSSQGQKEAHEKRAADAEPDEVIVSGDVQEPAAPVDFAAAEDQCPLLPHEKLDLEPESDEAPLLPHERSASVSSEDDEEEAVSSADFAPVEFDGDTPLFRHESISLSSPDSPPRSPSHPHSRSHTSLKDIMAEEDLNDPSLEPFPTRRDTIIEHIQGLANRLEEDRSVPEDSSVSSPHWSDSRSSSSDHLPPPSPLDSIQEDQELEVEDTEQLPQSTPAEPSSEQSAPAVPVGAVPTPPLTPKDEERGSTRLDRADSVVTVTAQEHTKDDKGATHDTDGSKDTPRSSDSEASEQQQQQPTHLQPSSASITDVDRPATPRSTRITPERKHSSFLINFWNSLFGSWLGPVVRWFSRVCGGKGRAT